MNEFLKALFASEGGQRAGIENVFGYIGKYQFGEDALIDIGYYKSDSSKNRTSKGKFKYDWIGNWTGKNGATSKDVFLASQAIQDLAAKDWIHLLCKRTKRYKLEKYIDEAIGGVHVTESGIIAAAHLKGFGNAKHPGVIQFLSSNGTTDGADANGTSVSKYMGKFADYDLGCCGHLIINLLDREKEPIVGLSYEIRSGKKSIKKGNTDIKGHTKKIVLSHQQTPLSIFVLRIEGGLKEIANFVSPISSAVVTLISPKVKVQAELESHKGVAGDYKAGNVKKQKSKKIKTGKAKTTSQRGIKGNPVAVVNAPESGEKELSGAAWEEKFPTSKSLDDLTTTFKTSVGNFINALKLADIKVRVSATYRPRERAYLMHYCCKIGNNEISANKIPPHTGVNIEWMHRDSNGDFDEEASRKAAKEMMAAYVIKYPAALKSRHTEKRAVDMTITGFNGKKVENSNKVMVEISNASDLYELGKTYGVIKLKSDPPHWSDDGH